MELLNEECAIAVPSGLALCGDHLALTALYNRTLVEAVTGYQGAIDHLHSFYKRMFDNTEDHETMRLRLSTMNLRHHGIVPLERLPTTTRHW